MLYTLLSFKNQLGIDLLASYEKPILVEKPVSFLQITIDISIIIKLWSHLIGDTMKALLIKICQ